MRRYVTPLVAAIVAAQPAFAGQYVLELDAALEPPPAALMLHHGVTLDETLSAGADSYAVFSAEDAATLQGFLDAAAIRPEKISEVLFVNSPAVGGGVAASHEPRPGHQVYVIERPIPGVGFLGLERKQANSANSNEAVALLGDIIEWAHSYLTSEGTYCVYRADSSETLREHGALAGVPIGRITAVDQQLH
jgi:hypothetical protein